MYGLSCLTTDSVLCTIEQALQFMPDRIAPTDERPDLTAEISAIDGMPGAGW